MILVNNLSRSRINAGKVKFKTSKILKLLRVFNFEDKRKVNPKRSRGVNDWYLEVNFVTAQKMSLLHKKFLKKSGPTTVISVESGGKFPVGELFSLGEIYLCPQEIEKSGLGLEHFLVHGVLHLYGYDHKTKKGEAAMLEKEKQICAKIGL